MKPIYLAAENLKGGDFAIELKPVNIVIGANGSGKSRILWASIVALLGYHPRLGKQNQQTITLMGDDRLEMSVTMRFEGDLCNQRTWKRTPGGDIKKIEKCDIADIPPVMFDLRSYLTLTKKERIKMIFDKIEDKALQFDEEALIKNLLAIEVLPAALCKKAIAELEAFLKTSLRRRKVGKINVQDWLTNLSKELDDEKKRFSVLEQQASAQMIGLRNDAATPKSVEDKLDAKTKEMQEVKSQLDIAQNNQETFTRHEQRLTYLKNIIAREVPDVTEKQKFADELRIETSKYRSALPQIRADISSKLKESKSISDEMQKLESSMFSLNEKLKALEQHQKCPFCKSNRQGWKDEYSREISEQLKIAEGSYKELSEKYDVLVTDGKTLRGKESEAQKADQDADAKSRKILSLNAEIKSANELASEKKAAEAELSGLSQGVKAVSPQEIQALTEKYSALSSEFYALTDQQKAYLDFKANSAKSNETQQDLLFLRTKVEVFKKASVMVVAEQEKIVTTAFDPLLAVARKFTDGILPGALGYKDGELGMQTDMGWVNHEVMETSMQTVAYIGVSIALAQQSPVKLVLLDEAGIVDPENKDKVVRRLEILASAGDIDCAILADPTDAGYPKDIPNNMQVIHLPIVDNIG